MWFKNFYFKIQVLLKSVATLVFYGLNISTEVFNHRFQCSLRDSLQELNHFHTTVWWERKGWLHTCHIRENTLITVDK